MELISYEAISIKYYERVSVALVIQHAKRMRIKFSSIACFALRGFPTLSHKWHDFRKTFTIHKTCLLIFSTSLFEKFLTLRRIQRDNVINVYSFSRKVPVILFKTLMKIEFSEHIFEKYSNIKFH